MIIAKTKFFHGCVKLNINEERISRIDEAQYSRSTERYSYLELKKDLTSQIVEANQLPSRTNKTNPHKDTQQLNLVQYINFKEKILKIIKRKIKLPIKNDDNLSHKQ